MGSPKLGRGFLQGTALHLHSLKLTTLQLVAGVDRDSATSHLRVGSRAARNLDAAGSATSSPRLVRGPAIILALQPTQKCGVAATRAPLHHANIVFFYGTKCFFRTRNVAVVALGWRQTRCSDRPENLGVIS